MKWWKGAMVGLVAWAAIVFVAWAVWMIVL